MSSRGGNCRVAGGRWAFLQSVDSGVPRCQPCSPARTAGPPPRGRASDSAPLRGPGSGRGGPGGLAAPREAGRAPVAHIRGPLGHAPTPRPQSLRRPPAPFTPLTSEAPGSSPRGRPPSPGQRASETCPRNKTCPAPRPQKWLRGAWSEQKRCGRGRLAAKPCRGDEPLPCPPPTPSQVETRAAARGAERTPPRQRRLAAQGQRDLRPQPPSREKSRERPEEGPGGFGSPVRGRGPRSSVLEPTRRAVISKTNTPPSPFHPVTARTRVCTHAACTPARREGRRGRGGPGV